MQTDPFSFMLIVQALQGVVLPHPCPHVAYDYCWVSFWLSQCQDRITLSNWLMRPSTTSATGWVLFGSFVCYSGIPVSSSISSYLVIRVAIAGYSGVCPSQATLVCGRHRLLWCVAVTGYSGVWPSQATLVCGRHTLLWCVAVTGYSDVWPSHVIWCVAVTDYSGVWPSQATLVCGRHRLLWCVAVTGYSVFAVSWRVAVFAAVDAQRRLPKGRESTFITSNG